MNLYQFCQLLTRLLQRDGVETFFTIAVAEVPYQSVSCGLPLTPRHPLSSQPYYTWTVSISNNNVTFSNDERLFVYDSKCLECHNNTADSCEQKVSLRNLQEVDKPDHNTVMID